MTEYSVTVTEEFRNVETTRTQPYVYSTSQTFDGLESQHTDVREIDAQRAAISRPSTNTNNEGEKSLIPAFALVAFGSIYFLIILSILLILPIIEVAIGASYRNQCPVNPNIPVYLIVTGACGIGSIVLLLITGLAFTCSLTKNSVAGSVATGAIVALVLLIIFLMSIFLFIWFIIGNVWIFGVRNRVSYNITSVDYCHPTLYQFAVTILVLSYIMTVVSCCSSCFRGGCKLATRSK